MPAKAGIHDFTAHSKEKSWMPTPAFARGRLCVGMTMLALSVCQSLGRLVVRRETDKE
jgi:hypothetical protein